MLQVVVVIKFGYEIDTGEISLHSIQLETFNISASYPSDIFTVLWFYCPLNDLSVLVVHEYAFNF